MHFITGGAFNGKRAWVKERYQEAEWISAYDGDPFCEILEGRSIVVLEGLELWMKELSEKLSINQAREYLKKVFAGWQEWENSACNRQVIVIGSDISKGIVPMEKENRDWRDLTGWAYQDLTSICQRVDIIWYGINRTIKGEGM